MVVEIEFPKKLSGAPTTVSVLALVCPDAPGPDQTPMVIGNNAKASLPKWLAQLCEDTSGVSVAHTLGINSTGLEKEMSTTELLKEIDCDGVGCVRWEGPGPLTLPAGGSCNAICKVVLRQPLKS